MPPVPGGQQQQQPPQQPLAPSEDAGAGSCASSPSRKWKVDTYCRVKPKLSGAAATHIRYDFRGPSSDKPSTTLRIGLPAGSAPYIWNNRRNDMDFRFTEVFCPDVQQEYVYERVARDVVYSSLSGYNGTIFAYGQTGSGKTFTMTGGDSFTERGLIPRAIHDVYKEIKRRPGKRFRVLISYMEIYKENVYDLLDLSSRNKPLDEWTKIQMLDDEDGEMHLRNLKLYEAASEEEALNLLFLGNWNRITSATPMNEASSRSHCIFTLRIQGEGTSSGGRTTVSTTGKLHLVDLAGSERMYKTDAETMLKTRIEGRYINLSLHYLEQVIVTLQEKSGRPRGASFHIPYRNSVMTSILKDSLGGNCRTVFVVTLNTEVDHLEELISTCRFALRCAQLSMDVLANEEVNAEELAASLKLEVGSLRSRLGVQEKQLQEVLQQLQALHTQHKPRQLTGQERDLCQTRTRDFVQSPGEDSSWVYDTDRPLLEECLRLLRHHTITIQHEQQRASMTRSQAATTTTSSTGRLFTTASMLADSRASVQSPPPPPQPEQRSSATSSSLLHLHRTLDPSTTTTASSFPFTSGRGEDLLLFDTSPPRSMMTGGGGKRGGGAKEDSPAQHKPAGDEYSDDVYQHGKEEKRWQQRDRQQKAAAAEGDDDDDDGVPVVDEVEAADDRLLYHHHEEEEAVMMDSAEEAPHAAYFQRLLTRGGHFLKEGRQGRWHARFVLASGDLERLMWRKAGEVEVRGWVPMAAFEDVALEEGGGALTLCGQKRHVTLELVVEEEEDGSQGGGREEARAEWAEAFRYAIRRSHHHQARPATPVGGPDRRHRIHS